MKGSEQFKAVIQKHLDSLAEKDPLFSETLKKENKNIDDCITYILNTVQKSGCNGFSDDEIFGMAAHYYDEDTVEVGKPGNGRVVVNHKVEMTEEEKKLSQQRRSGNLRKQKAENLKPKKVIHKPVPNIQNSIFD
jgi:hypothetical protein